MLRTALIALMCAFLASCGGSEPKTQLVTIPVPADKNDVEPTVARLLQKTGNEVHLAIEDPMTWMRHGSALFANAYYNESIVAFKQAIFLNPEMPQATYLLATALWKENELEEAIHYLQVALSMIPEYDIGWRLLAQWQLERGETTQAENSALKAFELNSNRVGTRYILALSMMDDGRYEEALQILEEPIIANRAQRWIYKLAGQCYRQLGEIEQAEQALKKSGPPSVDWPDPMFKHIPNLIMGKSELALYALHLHETSHAEKAIPFLSKALRIDPKNVNVRAALSMALQHSEQLERAEQVLVEIQGEPTLNYWKQYAGVCVTKKNFTEAEEHILKALELDANDANAHEIAAVIAKEQGDYVKAVLEWEVAGELYVESRKWEKVEKCLASASMYGQLSDSGLYFLAYAQIELEQFSQAERSIQKLLQIQPNDEKTLALQSRLPKE